MRPSTSHVTHGRVTGVQGSGTSMGASYRGTTKLIDTNDIAGNGLCISAVEQENQNFHSNLLIWRHFTAQEDLGWAPYMYNAKLRIITQSIVKTESGNRTRTCRTNGPNKKEIRN